MNKRIFLVIGVIILFIMIAIGASTYTIIHSLIQKEKEAFKPQVENILKEAVANNTIQKCKDIPLNGFNNSPNKIGTYETRTFFQEIPCLPISTKFKTWIVKYYSLANWGYL